VCLLVGLALSGLTGCGKQPIAIVGQTKITRAEFLDKLERDSGREALIGMINQRLVDDACAAASITVTPEEVQEQLKTIKDQLPSPEAFAKALAQRGMTEQDLVDRITVSRSLVDCGSAGNVTSRTCSDRFKIAMPHSPFRNGCLNAPRSAIIGGASMSKIAAT